MRGEWLRRPKEKTSVVFVHGILSSGDSCWRSTKGSYWPQLLEEVPYLKALGIYVFTYQTGIFSGSYSLLDVVDALKEHMRLDRVAESDSIVFVCHSMGGIVVRKYIVDHAVDLIQEKKTVGLFLVASPSLGAVYADWLSPLAKLFGQRQADALRFVRNNEWLLDLDRQFTNLKEGGKLRLKGKELVEDKFLVLTSLWRRQVVERFAGARYFGDPYKVPGSDHFTIAKPDDQSAIQHRQLCKFISEDILSEDLLSKPLDKKSEMGPLGSAESTKSTDGSRSEPMPSSKRVAGVTIGNVSGGIHGSVIAGETLATRLSPSAGASLQQTSGQTPLNSRSSC
jgi:pimeloyl-ACP methyl ester carboxylesterase